jgi:hypothetical protein
MWIVHRKLLHISGLALILIVTGCSSQASTTTQRVTAQMGTKIEGAKEQIFGQNANSWEVLEHGETGRVTGLSLPLKAIEVTGTIIEGPISFDMPSDIKKSTFIDHVDVQYERKGLASNFTKPVFVFRIYGISKSEQSSIDCTDNAKINPDLVPDGYTDPSDSNGVCEKEIGRRSVAKSETENPDHPTPFARVNYGYYKGKIIFIEVVITVEELLQRNNFTINIPSPKIIGSDAQIPSTFTGIYQSESDSYDLSIWAFVNPDSSQSSQ